ncbi:MAG: hypothetical protein ACOYO9_07950 [Candidatus Nanopelagicales bacterium]
MNNSASVNLRGLLSRVIVNGSTSLGPVGATQLAPGTRRAMNAPTSAVLFAAGRTASFVYDGGSFKRS